MRMRNDAVSSVFKDSKPHYAILDGLRGVAALVVIWYHVFEGFATSPMDQHFNHGYLAVGWSLADWNLPGGFLDLLSGDSTSAVDAASGRRGRHVAQRTV